MNALYRFQSNTQLLVSFFTIKTLLGFEFKKFGKHFLSPNVFSHLYYKFREDFIDQLVSMNFFKKFNFFKVLRLVKKWSDFS